MASLKKKSDGGVCRYLIGFTLCRAWNYPWTQNYGQIVDLWLGMDREILVMNKLNCATDFFLSRSASHSSAKTDWTIFMHCETISLDIATHEKGRKKMNNLLIWLSFILLLHLVRRQRVYCYAIESRSVANIRSERNAWVTHSLTVRRVTVITDLIYIYTYLFAREYQHNFKG